MVMRRNPLRSLGAVPFDNSVLQSLYPDCKCINDKASQLALDGYLFRLKKGLYVVSSEDTPLSMELIANTIYGPSYVSMNWAMSYWNMIPERVHMVESVTTKHSREFYTPIGLFPYHCCPWKYFGIGVTLREFENGINYMIAGPEKALCDYISFNKVFLRYRKDVSLFLEEDIRLDMDIIKEMDSSVIEQCALTGPKRKSLLTLLNYVRREQRFQSDAGVLPTPVAVVR